jgi:AhpD family alkylhydroperoxidase
VLDRRFREQIALAVAQANSCEYCLAAHTALGTLAGLTLDEIAQSRASRALDLRRHAGLQFAQTIVVNRGQVSDASVAAVREAGFGDAEITEIVANVVLNIFTNYINHVAQTAVDFPPVTVALTAVA